MNVYTVFVFNIYMHILYLQKIVCRVLSILYIIEYILYKRCCFFNYNGSFIIKGNWTSIILI